jgi:ubiquinone biosynthesis protein
MERGSAISVLRTYGRAVVALGVLAAVAAEIAVGRLPWLGRRRMATGMLGSRLARRLERLGGAYLKVGQVLSTRPDLLGAEDRAPLARLCDQVESPAPAACIASLRSGLGPQRFAVLREIGERPIAAGSVTHVHRGRRRDTGEAVAIKVLREDAPARFGSDLAMIRGAMRLGSRLPLFASVPMGEAADALADSVAGNLDLRREARAHLRLAEELPSESVSVPRLHADLCTDRVLVMDFVPGALRIDDPALPSERRSAAALTALRALYGMLFRWGLVHCDLHPGNLLVTGNGQLVLIDFGYVAELGRGDRTAFAELFLGMALGEPGRVRQVLLTTAVRLPPRLEESTLQGELDVLVAAVSGAPPRSFNVAGFVTRLFAIQRRHGIVASPGFTMGIMALVSLEGLLKSFVPDLDFQREAIPYVLPDEPS